MTFDVDLDKMAAVAFGVSSFTTTKFCESSLAKKLEKKVKGILSTIITFSILFANGLLVRLLHRVVPYVGAVDH